MNYQEMSAPFFYKGRSKKAALLIHGFLASPYIMRSIGKVLHEQDYTVQAICLPGHGTDPNDLRTVTAIDWQTAVNEALLELQRGYDEVIIVGFSMGAILGLNAAFELNIKKLILMCPAFRISPAAQFFKIMNRFYLTGLMPELFCTQSEKVNLGSYTRFPVQGVIEVQKVIDRYRKLLLTQKHLPHIYVAASTDDATVQFSGVMNAMDQYLGKARFRIYTENPSILDSRSRGYNQAVIDACQFDQVTAFSHVAIPVAPNDPYFGKNGSYYGKLPDEIKFGEPTWRDKKKPIKRLTYNPDFAAMAQDILQWLGND